MGPHWGPSKQVLRYHLGLKAAPKNTSSQWLSIWDCTFFGSDEQLGGMYGVAEEINIQQGTFRGVWKRPDVWRMDRYRVLFERYCPEQRLGWSQGGDLLFDDTFVHTAVNLHSEERVVLWLDVARLDLPWRHDLLNRLT